MLIYDMLLGIPIGLLHKIANKCKHSHAIICSEFLTLVSSAQLQGVQVQSGPFISSIVFIPLVVRGCNIHFIIQKGGENDAQLLKL